MKRAAPLALAIAAALGCDRGDRRTAGSATAAVSAVALAEIPEGAWDPPGPRTRIIVSAEAIHVDDAALFGSWSGLERDRLLQSLPAEEAEALPFFHRDLLRIDHGRILPPDDLAKGQMLLRPLHEVLDYEWNLERAHLAMDPDAGDEAARGELDADVYLDHDTPYELVVHIVYTVSLVGFSTKLVARDPRGDVAIPLDTMAMGEPACPTPELTLSPRGVMIVLGTGLLGAAGSNPAASPIPAIHSGPAIRRWRPPNVKAPWGKVIVGEDFACPSVPAAPPDGAIQPSYARLVAMLREIAKAAPGCGVVQLAATPETPWRDVAGAISAAKSAGYGRLRLATAPETAMKRDCAGALTPRMIRVVDLPEE